MTSRRSRAWIGLLGACLLVSCRAELPSPAPAANAPPVSAPPSAPTPEQAAAARRTLVAWFDCEECVDGELDAVLQLGPLAGPTLAATLRGGPSPAARERLRRELRMRHAELRAYASTHPAVHFDISESAWVDEGLANQLARHQVRSAQALARIGGAEAQKALTDALGDPLRADVAEAVRSALASVNR